MVRLVVEEEVEHLYRGRLPFLMFFPHGEEVEQVLM
jgi:hypothetical protein